MRERRGEKIKIERSPAVLGTKERRGFAIVSREEEVEGEEGGGLVAA